VGSPWLTTTFTATTMSTSTPHVQADIAISPVRNFGEISEAAIRQAVQDRFCLLVLLSYETCDSQWCRLEWTWHVGPAALYLLRVLVRLAFGDSLDRPSWEASRWARSGRLRQSFGHPLLTLAKLASKGFMSSTTFGYVLWQLAFRLVVNANSMEVKSCMKRADVSAALEQSLLIVFDSPLSAIVDIA
jgi:hypothetical protein